MNQAPWYRDGMNRVRFFYLLVQGAFGIYLPFIYIYFAVERGLSGQEIGILAAVAPLMTLVVAPVWGAVADRRGSRLLVLRWVLAGTAAMVLLLGIRDGMQLLLPAMGLFALFQVAIIPLGDGVISAAAAGRNVSYGSLRLWGSLGFAIGGLLLGQLARWFGMRAIFPVYSLLLLLALPVMWRMIPEEPPPSTSTGRGMTISLLRNRSITLFLAIAGLAAIGITAGYLFLNVFLHSLGASSTLIGAVSATGALVEIPLMLWGGRLIQRHRAPIIFAVGAGLFAVGWGLYAQLQTPAMALVIQALNGAAMGLLWPAGVTYMAQQVPAERSATAQSLLSAMMYGFAPLLATQLAGLVFDKAGARAVLNFAAVTMVASLMLFTFTRRWVGARSQEQAGTE